jgi:hypothetical protein
MNKRPVCLPSEAAPRVTLDHSTPDAKTFGRGESFMWRGRAAAKVPLSLSLSKSEERLRDAERVG